MFVNCSQNGQLGLYQNQCTFGKIHSLSTGGAHSRLLAHIASPTSPPISVHNSRFHKRCLERKRAGKLSKFALCQVSWIFPAPCYCRFYSYTSPSQKQRTHLRYLSRQMFLFHSHSVSIGSVFGVSLAHQRLCNHRLISLYKLTW